MLGNRLVTTAAAWAVMLGVIGAGTALAQSTGTPGTIPPPPVYPPPADAGGEPEQLMQPLPLLAIDETTYDAGTVWQGQEITHTFTFRNEGDDNLTLKMVRKSCGCTAVDIPNKLVPPGTSSPVTTKVSTRGKRSRFSVNASIGTNDPLMPEVKLTIKGEAKPFIDVKPQPSAIFGRVVADQPQSREFTLTGNLDLPLHIDKVEFDTARFEHTLTPIEEGKSYTLTVSTVPPLKRGANNGTCIITTNYEEAPQVRIRCSAYVPERLALRPERLTLTSPTSFSDAQRVIYLQDEGEVNTEIVSVRTTDENITVAYDPHPSGRGYRVTVNIKPGLVIPPEGHSVFIETTDEEYRVMELKIYPRRTVPPRQPPAARPQPKAPEKKPEAEAQRPTTGAEQP